MGPKDSPSLEEYARQREADLLADLARANAEVARLTLELGKVQKALGIVTARHPEAQAEPGTVGTRGPYTGLALADAAVEILKGQKKPVSVGMLCNVLEQAGFEFLTIHPTRALGEALRKRMLRHGDIFTVSSGLWGFNKNFSPAQLTKLTKKHSGLGGRSRETHVDLTIKGVEEARAKGKRIGAKSKLTVDVVREIRRLLQSGKSVSKACKAVGISAPTYYNHRADIERWNEGQPWPPTDNNHEGGDGSASPSLRLVK
jgi:hypothetical protein